jgi:hypothetical protein
MRLHDAKPTLSLTITASHVVRPHRSARRARNSTVLSGMRYSTLSCKGQYPSIIIKDDKLRISRLHRDYRCVLDAAI